MPFDDYDDFNQGDQLRLQSLNQGLAQADESLQRDEIDGNDHAALVNQIHSQRAPLVARQKVAFEKALNEQQQMQMRFQAHSQAMEHQNNVFEATNFPDRVGMYTDPMTGNTAHFLKDDKGDWNEIEFKHANQEAGGDGEEGAVPYHPLSEMLAAQLPAATPGAEAGPAGATQVNIGGRSFSSPWSGGDKVYDAQGNEIKGGWDAVYGQKQQQGGLLSEAALGEIWRRANMSVRMQPGPHRDAAVARLFDHMVGLHTHAKMAEITQAARTKEREAHEQYMERHQAASEKAKQDKEARDEEKKLHHEERGELSKSIHSHLSHLNRQEAEYNKMAADPASKPEEVAKRQRAWMGDDEAKQAEAERRARGERERSNPDYYAKYHPKPKKESKAESAEGGNNVIRQVSPEEKKSQADAVQAILGQIGGGSQAHVAQQHAEIKRLGEEAKQRAKEKLVELGLKPSPFF